MPSLRDVVAERANHRCEYCHAPEHACGYRFHVEHIIPRKRGGSDAPSNRALACASCNLAKGAKVHGADPRDGNKTELFHPRRDNWSDHFTLVDGGERIVGLTPRGRATVAALDMNSPSRMKARELWYLLGWLR